MLSRRPISLAEPRAAVTEAIMTTVPLPDGLAGNATWLVQAIDPHSRMARLVRMDDQAYRDASFLDDRMLAQGQVARLCSLDELVAVSNDIAEPPANWIFHIGHVGSTLISRLLGELEGVLAIREPRSLRDLDVATDEERQKLAKTLAKLLARRRPNDRAVVVKATSFVSEYAPFLVEQGAAALFLFTTPENYIAGILAGENSLKELDALHASRLDRLKGRGIELSGFDASAPHRAALAWACEMTSLECAAEEMPDRQILWADFDAMLGEMTGWLARTARHFGLDEPDDRIEQLATGPLMRSYSKAPEYDYSPGLRAELLADTIRRHGQEIFAAVEALREVAASVPPLERALDRAGTEN